MKDFVHNTVNVYGVKKRSGKTYTLIKKEDTKQYIDWLNYFQCYTNRFYNISIKPYRGNHWNKEKFHYIVEG